MSSPATTPVQNAARPFERYLAVIAALGCVAITIAVWLSVSAMQPMWPLPALYLIEVSVLSTLAAIAFVSGGSRSRIIAWAVVGILAAFCILGILSVGGLYVPTALLLATVCFKAGFRDRSTLGMGVAIAVLSGLAQAAVMLIMIRLV